MRAATALVAAGVSSNTIETGSLISTLNYVTFAISRIIATLTTMASIDAVLGLVGGVVVFCNVF